MGRKIKNDVKRYEENLSKKDKEAKKMTKFIQMSCPGEMCTVHNKFHRYGLVSLQCDR